MQTFSSRVDDIDQFTCDLNVSDWQHNFLQLSPGPLQFSNRVVQLDGLVIYWNHFGARVRVTESYLGDWLIFGVILQSDKPFLFDGHEFPKYNAAVQHPGSEQNYVVPANLDSLMIHVDRSLITETGLRLSKTVEKSVPAHALRALVTECRYATSIVQQPASGMDDEIIEKTLRYRIIERLAVALSPWSSDGRHRLAETPPPTRDYLLFKKAESEMIKTGLGTRPSMDQLAGMLDVSRRTLFYAFNKWVGMGPNTYFETLRLHYVRDRLLAGRAPAMRVTEVANEFGFNHLGRFSGQYYRFFGEYPSETLVRENLIQNTAPPPPISDRKRQSTPKLVVGNVGSK